MDENVFQGWRKERFEGELNGSVRWNRRNDMTYSVLQLVIEGYSGRSVEVQANYS